MPTSSASPTLLMGCQLCTYGNSNHPVMDEILSFVSDSAEHIPLDEVCSQVKVALETKLDIHMSAAQIRQHFLNHRCAQPVVLSHVMRDLVDILCVAKSNCIVVSAETGQEGMDAKNTSVYLDTIKQIMSVYKQVETCGKRKRVS